jgi:hexosaminidase
MKISIFIAAIVYLFSSLLHADELNLMPYPQSVNIEEGNFVFSKNITLEMSGNNSPQLTTALTRFFQRVTLQTGIHVHAKKSSASATKFIINIKNPSVVDNRFLVTDESYGLIIDPQKISLTANTDIGALRGLETLLQLIGIQKKKIILPLVNIKDSPRFKWRGLLLDCSRHFFSVETIKRQLDAMAAAKYNVFHWHLTDDQGWRIESKKFPKLQQLASGGEYYTQDDIRNIVNYARQLGIQVLPEIDMPGHASALAIAYPELMSAPGPYQTELRWGVHKPTLNPANEKVYEFIDQLMIEVVDLFPFE